MSTPPSTACDRPSPSFCSPPSCVGVASSFCCPQFEEPDACAASSPTLPSSQKTLASKCASAPPPGTAYHRRQFSAAAVANKIIALAGSSWPSVASTLYAFLPSPTLKRCSPHPLARAGARSRAQPARRSPSLCVSASTHLRRLSSWPAGLTA